LKQKKSVEIIHEFKKWLAGVLFGREFSSPEFGVSLLAVAI
jgi:hypothetical protein